MFILSENFGLAGGNACIRDMGNLPTHNQLQLLAAERLFLLAPDFQSGVPSL